MTHSLINASSQELQDRGPDTTDFIPVNRAIQNQLIDNIIMQLTRSVKAT